MLSKGDDTPLVDYQNFGHDATLYVPTPDHYLPLLYVLGIRKEQDQVSFPVQGMDDGSVSMLAVRIG
jgi:4,5-DOPA dioxygenase extradiol